MRSRFRAGDERRRQGGWRPDANHHVQPGDAADESEPESEAPDWRYPAPVWPADAAPEPEPADAAPEPEPADAAPEPELENAANVLADSTVSFRQLAENSDDLVYLLQLVPTPAFVYLNPAAEQMTGYPRGAFYDRPDLGLERVHPEDRDTLERVRGDVDGIEEAFRYRWRRPDGHTVWFEERVTPLRDEAGRTVAVQGIVRDVTTRKRAEEAMRATLEGERDAVERLRHLNEMKDTFLQAVSHELRTPLTSVLGYAVTLEKRARDFEPDQIADFMGRIAHSARRLERLLTDLLDIDRMSRGIVDAERRPTDLRALIREVLAEIDFGDRTVSLDLEEPVTIDIDAPKIERVVYNLAANAAKYTPPGSTVWVRLRGSTSGAELVVEDDGPGLPQAGRESLFEPFGQGRQATSSASPGTGLGLSLVQRFVELHGGRVAAGDRPGGGARFTVSLPAAEDEESPRSQERASERRQPGPDQPVSAGASHRPRSSSSDEGPVSGPDPDRRGDAGPMSARAKNAVAEASRQLLHLSTPEEATGVLVSLVHELGGWTVGLGTVRADTLPLDLALGRGEVILPAADPGSVARKTLAEVLPDLVEQARRTLNIGRRQTFDTSSDATSPDFEVVTPGALTRAVGTVGGGDVIVVLKLEIHAPGLPYSATLATLAHGAETLTEMVLRVTPGGHEPLRSAQDALLVVFPGVGLEEATETVRNLRSRFTQRAEEHLSLSAGIAGVDGQGGAAALAAAEDALGTARGGPEPVVVATPSPPPSSTDRPEDNHDD